METAVLFISSFEGTDLPENDSKVFADVATKFVNNAARDGRTKLVIDVTRNPGGEISRGFDLFKLFFPNQFPYSATRFRRHTGADSLVEIFGALNKPSGNPLAFKANVKPDQTSDFKSLQDFLGVDQPAELGAPVSALYANFNYTNSALSGRPLRGFGNDTKLPKQGPFKAENIIIIGDGACSSTCTTFTNLMVNVGGVRTLAFGGRPKLAPMQVMGGVRGAQAAEFKFIDTVDSVANKFMASAPKGTFSEQLIKTANASLPPGLSKMPLVLPGGGVNLRNAYQKDNDHLPEQFSYQAADCRLFYTAENIVMPNTTWKAASDAIWGSKGCVKGSTGGSGSRGNNATGSQKADQGVIRSAGSTLPVAWSLIVACLSAALVW
ncbi:Peptidase S41 [Moelleriella libera RCEF 2490]|uniref:Peptidase S41 n=1 Tax=Moelleriella libera RCEF 2490 TaxID=1081109 RepID=A0A167VNJ0_9HYPO|nr:Peptidase S41 [Moelleriella libera RCEF 2490]